MPKPSVPLFALAAAIVAAPGAHALGVGTIRSSTVLGQPLNLSVPVRLETGDTLEPGCVRVQVMSGDSRLSTELVSADVELQPGATDGQLRIRTRIAIDEPLVTLTLELGCPARLTRQVVLFADPPEGLLPAPATLAAAPAVPVAPVVLPTPVAAASAVAAGNAVPPALPLEAAPASRSAVASAPAASTAAPAASAVAASNVPAPAMRVASAPAAARPVAEPTPPPPRRREAARPPVPKADKPAVVAKAAPAAPKPAAAPAAPRTAAVPAAGPKLKLDLMPTAGAELAAAQDQASAAEAAASAARTAAAAAEARVKELEAAVAKLQQDGSADRGQLSTLREQLATAQDDARWMPVLLAAVALLGAGCAVLGWRLRGAAKRQAQIEAWWRDEPTPPAAAAAPVPPANPPVLPASTAVVSALSDAPLAALAPSLLHEPPAGVVPSHVSATVPGAFDTTPQPSFAVASAHTHPAPLVGADGVAAAAPSAAATDFMGYADEPPAETPQPKGPLSVDEQIDLEQQVDFYLVLGQDDAAIDLLMTHLRRSGGASPMPYLKLLEIHRRRDEHAAYERTRERFNQRFNAVAPPWEADPQAGRTLEDYPEVMVRLQRSWWQPLDAMAVLETLLFRRGAQAELFDLPAYQEVLFLYQLARDLQGEETGTRDARQPPVDVLLPIDNERAPSVLVRHVDLTSSATGRVDLPLPTMPGVDLSITPRGAAVGAVAAATAATADAAAVDAPAAASPSWSTGGLALEPVSVEAAAPDLPALDLDLDLGQPVPAEASAHDDEPPRISQFVELDFDAPPPRSSHG